MGGGKKRYGQPFEYMPQTNNKVKKKIKDTDGKVITEPRGIYVNPPKKGHQRSTVGHTIERFPKHIPDDFESY